MVSLAIVIALLGVTAVLFMFFGKRTQNKKFALNAVAEELGLRVQEETREVPVWLISSPRRGYTRHYGEHELPSGRSRYILKSLPCTKYSLDCASKNVLKCSVLWRPEKHSDGFSKDWLFDVREGEASFQLKKALIDIAKNHNNEFFEWDYNGVELALYWVPHGTREMTESLHKEIMDLQCVIRGGY